MTLEGHWQKWLSATGALLSQGGRYLGQQAGLAIGIDTLMVGLFASYLVAVGSGKLPFAAHDVKPALTDRT